MGLRDLFLHAREIRTLLIPEAPAHSALLRLLYALTARITALDEAGPGSWGDRREEVLEQGLPEQSIELPDGRKAGIAGYFDQWSHRFDLFDRDRPWLQDPRLPDQCDRNQTAGVHKLVMSRSAGNNHSWFGHWSHDKLVLPTLSQSALSLLTWHYWGAPGALSRRAVAHVSHHYAKASPLRASLSYHPECDNLFLTLLAGLTPPDGDVSRQTDLCPWERDDLPDPLKPMPEPQGPCSRLTACSQHALYLVPAQDGEHTADAYITWAYDAERIRPEDDYLIWDIDKDGKTSPDSHAPPVPCGGTSTPFCSNSSTTPAPSSPRSWTTPSTSASTCAYARSASNRTPARRPTTNTSTPRPRCSSPEWRKT